MKKIALISNGDFRQSASRGCWPKQEHTLKEVEKAFDIIGVKTFRANSFKKEQGHGFMNTQAEVCRVFADLDAGVLVVIVLSSWVWAHHVASSLKLHKGPVLLLGNFDGTWPGLVALLNHSATLERMGITHSRIWSDSFSDDQRFMENLRTWVETGSIIYPTDHITGIKDLKIPKHADSFGRKLASDVVKKKRILGQMDPESNEVINIGLPVIHFNEGDLGPAIPQVLMNDILVRKSMPPETTLHDVRWGDLWEGRFVWVFEISGGAPPAHWGDWMNTHVYRQPSMYFPYGGGTYSGVSKPGTITWARFYESFGEIGMDLGTGEAVELPEEEVRRRRAATTEEWPIANVFIPGYERDTLMSSHKSNHITISYGDILHELASVSSRLGINVNVIGDARNSMT